MYVQMYLIDVLSENHPKKFKNPLVDSSVVYLNESCRRNPVSELKFVKFEKMAPRGMPSLSLSLSLSLCGEDFSNKKRCQ